MGDEKFSYIVTAQFHNGALNRIGSKLMLTEKEATALSGLVLPDEQAAGAPEAEKKIKK